jgi:ubiquinone/menaquinone biosynthesis C-methylase UbiE
VSHVSKGGDASASLPAHGVTALPGGVYTLGDGPAEQDRLQQQAGSLGALSEVLLDRVGIRPDGARSTLGCGPGSALGPLAARTGPGGHVTGVDLNPAHAATARDFAARRRLGNVQIVTADARRTGFPGGTFDLVHARLLMVNVPRPEEVAAEMARLAKPGGWVAALESDVTVLCYPPHPAVDRATALLRASYWLDGADPDLGRRLPHLFRDATRLAFNAAEALLAQGRIADAAALIDPLTTMPPDLDHWLAHVARAEIDLLRGDASAAAGPWQQIYAVPAGISRVDGALESAPRASEAALWAGRPAKLWPRPSRRWPCSRCRT